MSNDKQVEKFDPSKMMDGVKDRIKATFASLIPDEAWDEMVKKVVDDFFEVKKEVNRYNSKHYVTQFQILANNLLKDEAEKRFADYFKSKQFNNMWGGVAEKCMDGVVKDTIINNSGEILANMIGNMMNQKLQYVQQNMQSY